MSGFGGCGSVEIKIVLTGGIIGFFIGVPYGGLAGGLKGALIGSVGLCAVFLSMVFIYWAIGNLVTKIKGNKK